METLLEAGESQTVEFKKSFGRETVEALVAFSNAQGGTVLVGVANDGTPCGVSVGKKTLNEWLGQIKSGTSPSIIPDIELFTLHNQPIVRIDIDEYPVKSVNTKGRYLKRIATSNHQLSLSEITDLYLQSLQISWDAHEAPETSLDALGAIKSAVFDTLHRLFYIIPMPFPVSIRTINSQGKHNPGVFRFPPCTGYFQTFLNNIPVRTLYFA